MVEKRAATVEERSVPFLAHFLSQWQSLSGYKIFMKNEIDFSIDESINLTIRQEGDFFDRKSEQIKPSKVEKTAVAFANADGGELIIGIRDEKEENDIDKRWSGLSSIEGFNPFLQCLYSSNPPIPFRHQFLKKKGDPKFVLRIFIEKSTEVCQTADKTVYQRKGAQNIPLKDANLIARLSFAKGARSYEDTALSDVKAEQVVESEAIQVFVKQSRDALEPLSFCINEGLLGYDDFVPRAAAILLFSDNPPATFPKRCGVKIVYYDTRLEKPEREHLKSTHTVNRPLYDQIYESVRVVTEIMSNISIYTSEGLQKVKYPPEAIWEIIANAIIHRDYSIADDIQIFIYQNRIEVVSPGRLPGFVNIDNILDVRYSRNPKVVRCLNRYSNPPNKDLGEGLNTAFQRMKDWKLQSPQFMELENAFKVILPHTPLAKPEELVLEFLQSHSEITNSQAREISGIKSENQMKEVFYRMRDQSIIERVPEKKGSASAWRLKN